MAKFAPLVLVAAALSGCAATSPNYRTPEIRGDQPAVVVMRPSGAMGAGCLAAVAIDGKAVGTVAAGETLHVPVQPGQYHVRWDAAGGGLCGSPVVGLAQRLVTVSSGPTMLVLQVSGTGKMMIPLYGLFVSPEYRIVVNGDEG